MKVRVFAASEKGRKEKNDDHFCIGSITGQTQPRSLEVPENTPGFKERGLFLAVADGMGGYQGGQLASRAVLESLNRDFRTREGATLVKRFKKSLRRCKRHLWKILWQARCREAGTTLAGVVLKPPHDLLVFHIGDSRVMRIRDDKLAVLTVDHTPIGKNLALGKITLEKALERRDAHHLTRWLGMFCDSRVVVQQLHFQPGDRFLITTDGVSSPGRGLDAKMLKAALKKKMEPSKLVKKMLHDAVERDGDNATLVVVFVDP